MPNGWFLNNINLREVIDIEKRSLLSRIFGSKKDDKRYERMEMLSGRNSFSPWDGKIFENDIVRACIRPKSNAVGKLNAKHIRGFEENIQVNSTPRINKILNRPNRYMSMQDFLMKMVFQRELKHNAFAYVKRDNKGYPEEIYPIPYSRLEVLEFSNETFIKFYFSNGKNMAVHYADLIHLRKDYYSNDILGDDGNNAISTLMEVVDTTDKGLIQAVKESSIIRWIIKYTQSLREEDIKAKAKEFVDTYLKIDSEVGGAVATDAKAELQQVDPKNYVPNVMLTKEHKERIYSYFGVNENIVQNKYDEDEYNAFYESEIEPIAIQLSNEFTKIFFTEKELGHGNKILFESINLAYASMKTKLGLVGLVDRGIITPNEHRNILNLGPIEGGNIPIRRLDTVPVGETDIGGDEENDIESDEED